MDRIFSIITPTFNQGKFIAKTIEMILAQKGEFYVDYIIMDGGSTDNTVEEIKRFEELVQKYPDKKEINGLTYYSNGTNRGVSYRWWSKKDKGQSDAINQGFALAKGDIVTWLNSDDYFTTEDVLQHIADAFNNNEIDAIVGDTIALDGEGKELWRQTPGLPSLFTLLFLNITPQQPAIMYTKALIDKVGGVNEELHYVMDVDLWIRFCLAGARFHKMHEFLAVQVYHDAAKSTQGTTWFKKFAPEDRRIKQQYKSQLGFVKYHRLLLHKYLHLGKYALIKLLPKPVKDVLNKLIAWIRQKK